MAKIKLTNNIVKIPGIPVNTFNKVVKKGPVITFDISDISIDNIDKRPLPPIAFANYNTSNQIVISTNVFLPKSLVDNSEEINFQINEFRANSNELYYYLAYEAHPVASTEFYAYNLSFTSTENFSSGEISKVTVILWDEDPEGSRGTETTVQHGG